MSYSSSYNTTTTSSYTGTISSGSDMASMAGGVGAAAGMLVIGAGVAAVAGAIYCGKAVKRALDARAKAVAEAERQAMLGRVQNQAEANQVIQLAAQSFILVPAKGNAEITGKGTRSVQRKRAQQDFLKKVEDLRTRMSNQRTPEEARAVLEQFRAEQEKESRALLIAIRRNDLQAQLDEVQRVGLPSNTVTRVQQMIRRMEKGTTAEADKLFREGSLLLAEWLAKHGPAGVRASYELEQTRQEWAEAENYMDQQRLAVAQDGELARRLQPCFAEAASDLDRLGRQLESNPKETRGGVENLHHGLIRTIEAETLQLANERKDRAEELVLRGGALGAIKDLANDLKTLKVEMPTEAHQLDELENEMNRLQKALQDSSIPLADLPNLITTLKDQTAALREQLERKLATWQDQSTASTIAQVLSEEAFTGAEGQAVVAEQYGSEWRVSGWTPVEPGRTAQIEFKLRRDADGELVIVHEMEGFKGNTCQAAFKRIKQRLTERGITLNEVGEPYSYSSHSQEELANQIKATLEQLGYADIVKTYNGFELTLEAHKGIGFTHVTLMPGREPEVVVQEEGSPQTETLKQFAERAGTIDHLVETQRNDQVQRSRAQAHAQTKSA